jgi:hypothetical protein
MSAMNPVLETVQGNKIRISTANSPFTSINGSVIDPDIVSFGYIVNGGTPTTFTYTHGAPTPDPTNTIVRQGVGSYYIEVDTTTLSAGVLQYAIVGEPGSSALDTTRTKARFDGQIVIAAAPFPLG